MPSSQGSRRPGAPPRGVKAPPLVLCVLRRPFGDYEFCRVWRKQFLLAYRARSHASLNQLAQKEQYAGPLPRSVSSRKREITLASTPRVICLWFPGYPRSTSVAPSCRGLLGSIDPAFSYLAVVLVRALRGIQSPAGEKTEISLLWSAIQGPYQNI
jgi:hypothetical protein